MSPTVGSISRIEFIVQDEIWLVRRKGLNFLDHDRRFTSVKIFKLKWRKHRSVQLQSPSTLVKRCLTVATSTSSPLLWEKIWFSHSFLTFCNYDFLLAPEGILGSNMTKNTAIQCYFGIQIIWSLLLFNFLPEKRVLFSESVPLLKQLHQSLPRLYPGN